jgi:DNA-binding MarR family transcriptional regulator
MKSACKLRGAAGVEIYVHEAKQKRIPGSQKTGKTRPVRKRTGADAAPAVERVKLSDLSDHLGFLVRQAQLWVFKDVRRRLAQFDIGPAQYSILTVVNANPGINQNAVAEALTIERASIGRVVVKLEEQGYLSRLPSTVDRRSYVLHVTANGQKDLMRMRSIIYKHDEAFADKLGRNHYADLLRILGHFIALADSDP